MTDAHVAAIMELFDRKEEVAHVAQSVRMENIEENDYNLSVSSYVEAKDTREVINITELNREIEATVSKIDGLRKDIDVIVAEIDGA
jgi:type I restriction enzyme M protein